jgi:hypothetical protein
MSQIEGDVYAIEANGTDKLYIGSTILGLTKRFRSHISSYKRFVKGKDNHFLTSFLLFDEFGVENCKIKLLLHYTCSSLEELHNKETEYIKEYKEKGLAVNKTMTGIDSEEYAKKYRELNREKYNEYKKQYRIINKDKIKEYNEKNKDKKKEYAKYYNEANKDRINELKNQKIKCECGSEYRYGDGKRHSLTKKHMSYIEAFSS